MVETNASAAVVEDVPVSPAIDSPSPSEDVADLSEDQIFEKFSKPSGEEKPLGDQPEETPAKAEVPVPAAAAKSVEDKKTPEQLATEKAEAEKAEPYLKEVEPESFKKAFKSLEKWHPDVAKTLRDEHYKVRAFEENYNIHEVRALKEFFPTTEDAKAAHGAHADLLAVDDALRNDPPALLSYIQKQNPDAFIGLAKALPAALFQLNPQAFRDTVSVPAVQNYINFWDGKAAETQDEDLTAALAIIRDREAKLFGQSGISPVASRAPAPTRSQANDPRDIKLREYEQREQQQREAAAVAFRDNVDMGFDRTMTDEVGQMLDRTGADLTPEQRQEVSERAIADMKDGLLKDQILQSRLRSARDVQSTLDMLKANGKRFLGPAVARHLEWVTKLIVSNNEKQVREAARVVPRREVGHGSAPSSPSPSGKLTQAQQDALSADELFDAAAEGRL